LGLRGLGGIASQEIKQINLNLGARPRNKRAILGSKKSVLSAFYVEIQIF
jgi:hypothetical protein